MANLNWTRGCTIVVRSVGQHQGWAEYQAMPIVYRGLDRAGHGQISDSYPLHPMTIVEYEWDPRVTTLARLYPTRAERLMARIHCETT